jgi:cytolysin (calcineurin-like family phosphatase)
VGKNFYGVFYVHPSTLARYSSGRGYADFDQKFNIHIEAYVGGVLMDAIDKKKDPMGTDWYKSLRAIPSLVYRQDQCPFIMTDPDRYPAIKLPAEESGTGTGQ